MSDLCLPVVCLQMARKMKVGTFQAYFSGIIFLSLSLSLSLSLRNPHSHHRHDSYLPSVSGSKPLQQQTSLPQFPRYRPDQRNKNTQPFNAKRQLKARLMAKPMFITPIYKCCFSFTQRTWHLLLFFYSMHMLQHNQGLSRAGILI